MVPKNINKECQYYLSKDVVSIFGRVNVAAVLIDTAGRALICKRSDTKKFLPGIWHFPGGKVEEDEDFFQAIKRELSEELSLYVNDSIPLPQAYEYLGPNNVLSCTYFLFIRASGKIMLNEENQDYIFSSIEDLGSYIIDDSLRPSIQAMSAALKSEHFPNFSFKG